VPFTVSGDLKFLAVDDLGEAGPARGEPVVVYHNFLWNIVAVLPYLAIIALLVATANRNRSALWVLAPGVAVLGAFELLAWATAMPSNQSPVFFAVVLGCCAGLTALLLRDCRGPGRPRGAAAWVAALGWGGGAGLAVAVFSLWGTWDSQSFGALIAFACLFFCLVCAVAVARLAVRRTFTAFRFVLGCLAGCLVMSGVISALVIGSSIAMSPGNPQLLDPAMWAIPVGIISLAFLGLLMPYAVTALAVAELRARLQAMLGVGEAVEAAAKAELTKLELD
jgi:hypothetical protein